MSAAATASATSLSCECGHPKRLHHDGFDDCSAGGCSCAEFRRQGAREVVDGLRVDTVTLAERAGAAADAIDGLDQILDAGRISANKRTRSLAEKVAALHAELLIRLTDERTAAEERRRLEKEQAAARLEVEQLEAKLKAAKERLKPAAKPVEPTSRDKTPCPECGEEYANVGVHRARKHGYRAAAS